MSLNPRYKNNASNAFSDQNILNAWRDAEVAVLRAKASAEPDNSEFEAAARALSAIGDVNVARKEEIEKETKHDLVAAIRAMSEQVDAQNPGKNYGRLIHQGITSYDTEDTAQSLLLTAAGKDMQKSLWKLSDALMQKAKTFKYAPCNGYTHSQIAEPITIGKRFLDAAVGIDEQSSRFAYEIDQINQCKIKGATGIYSGSLSPQFETMVAAILEQSVSKTATQILPIEDMLNFFHPFPVIASKVQNLAYSLCLSSGDLAEVKEGFAKGQTGSSVMTFKQNPINLENVIGAARKIKGLYSELMDATLTLRERDISNSFQVVRHIIPELFETMEHLAKKMTSVVNGMGVFPIQALRNINKYGDFVYAGAAKDFIATNFSGGDNKEIYSLVQKYSMESKFSSDYRGEAISLADALAPKVREIGGDEKVAQLKAVMSLPYNLRNVSGAYNVALNDPQTDNHNAIADYIIESGQMEQFKQADSWNWIKTYAGIVRANYDNSGAEKAEYSNLDDAMQKISFALQNTRTR
ncbi:MAG: hypothetical protein LBB23_01805 [Rickettsiales bacterium]|jgi:adenylosuccinate lyase|nr:hypothetical protein [Rickettsiales bacterium]